MSQNERFAAVCSQCKAGTPVRWRPETREFVHEHIRTNDAIRMTSFSQVYCTATPLRIEDNG